MNHILTTIARMMEEHDLPGLLIGGHAVTSLGHPRATFDVDLLVPRESAADWQRHLLPLGYSVFGSNENFLQLEPGPDWPLPTIDLMLVDRDVFQSLHEDRLAGPLLPTPSIPGMIALKLHATRQPSRTNVEQDWSDILALIDLGQLSLDDPAFSAIVTRHGGREAIVRIEAHLA